MHGPVVSISPVSVVVSQQLCNTCSAQSAVATAELCLCRAGGQRVSPRSVFSTTIGPGLTRLGSHWSRASECCLRQQSYAINNQNLSLGGFGCPSWFFMAQDCWRSNSSEQSSTSGVENTALPGQERGENCPAGAGPGEGAAGERPLQETNQQSQEDARCL